MPLRFSPTAGSGTIVLTGLADFSLDLLLGSIEGTFAVRDADGWSARTIVGADLPNPSTTTLGGVFSFPATGTSVLSGIGNDGQPTALITTGTGNVVRAGAPSITGDWSLSGTLTITSTSVTAFTVGRLGAVTPVLQVNANSANQATGLLITGQSAASAVVNVAATAAAASNIALTFDAMGTGTIDFGINSTGSLNMWRATNFLHSGAVNFFGSTSGFTNLKAAAAASGTVTLPAATDTLVGKATTDTLTNKTYNTQGTGNVFTLNGAAFGTHQQAIVALNQLYEFVVVTGINFNAGNTDTAFVFPSPPSGFTRYSLRAGFISGASGTLASATCGVFTATAAGGTALVASGTAVTVTTASDSTAGNMQVLSPVNVNTMGNLFSALAVANTIYFRVQTAAGAANTASVELQIQWLP